MLRNKGSNSPGSPVREVRADVSSEHLNSSLSIAFGRSYLSHDSQHV